jgi:hypothetical protein
MPTTSEQGSREQPRSLCGCTAGTAAIVGAVLVLMGSWFVWRVVQMSGDLSRPYGSDGPSSGWIAVWLGDLDGDRAFDLALKTAFEEAHDGPYEWGVTRVLSGATGKELKVLHGTGAFARLHEEIGPAGDIDGDGLPEIWWSEGRGELLVGEVGEDRPLHRLRVGLCAEAEPLGDLDGDRCTDLLVRAYLGQPEKGRTVAAISGRTGDVLWTLGTFEEGRPPGIDCGGHMTRLDDVNGDRITDVAMIDVQERLLLVSGADGEVLRALPHRIDGSGSLEALGDLDGDGLPELLVHRGWPDLVDDDWQPNPVQIVSAADGEVLASHPAAEFVWSAFSPGDVDGDGRLDVAWCADGSIHVVSALDGRSLLDVEEGYTLPGRGDWNADGCADLLVIHNVHLELGEEAPDDLWRQGRVEVISGKDGSVLRVYDEGVLP